MFSTRCWLRRILCESPITCGMPQWSDKLLQWASGKDEGIRWRVYRVLANHRHPAIRNLAWERFRESRMVDGELRLLLNNYEPDDRSQLRRCLKLPKDGDECHEILQDLAELYERIGGAESASPMLLVYEHSPCRLCRTRAVEALLANRQSPAWLLEECRFDCSKEARELVQSPAAGPE